MIFSLQASEPWTIDGFSWDQLSLQSPWDLPGNDRVQMIVCSCNVFTDHDVRSTLSSGDSVPRTTGQVYHCLGCSAQCGRCARTIRRIMDEALAVPGAASTPPCCRNVQVES